MPLVYLSSSRLFFLWGEELRGALTPLKNRASTSFAELIVPPGKREPLGGLAVLLEDAIPRLAPLAGAAFDEMPASVQFWARAARLAVDLVIEGKLLPRATREGAFIEARWSVLGGDASVQTRLRQLAQAAPPAAHAVPLAPGKDEMMPASEALAQFLDEAVDLLVRSAATRASLPAALRVEAAAKAAQEKSWGRRWGVKLASPDRRVLASGLIERRMNAAVSGWGEPALGADQLRAAFRLEFPEKEGGPFLLRFLLQDVTDPSLLITSDEIWNSDGQNLRKLGRLFRDPVASLLRGLVQAAPWFAPIARALGHAAPEAIELDLAGASAFLDTGAPALEKAGFGVLIPGELTAQGQRLRLQVNYDSFDRMADQILDDGEPSVEEWLSFEWRVALGEETLTQEEFEALARQKSGLVQHRGKWVRLDLDDLPKIRQRLKAGRGKVRTREALVASLAGESQVDGLRVQAIARGRFARVLERLRSGADREIEPPGTLQATLRPYQLRGLAWLSTMASLGLGGCLADDMGLGKTVQLIAFILRCLGRKEPPRGPALLVAPTSVIGNWEREIRRFAPSLRVVNHYGAGRADRPDELASHGGTLILTTYGLLWRDVEVFKQVPWWLLALDEAQNIKNADTATSKAARLLDARYRFALTGTPVENRLAELWSLLDFANPGLLGAEDSFRETFAAPIERGNDPEVAARLRRIVAPFVLRRHKSDPTIAPDLPAKDEMKVICTLTREQATLYQATVDEIMEAIRTAHGIARKGLILALLTKLKQICNHPAQFLRESGPLPRRSGKLSRLTEMLSETLAEGERALIFTQFRGMGNLLVKHLARETRSEILYLHGETPREARDEMVERFQRAGAGDPKLFVLSLKAGGTGLNLTAASHVFHFDRWWNPAVEDQATDRAYRIGQTHHVQVFKYICAGTIEDKIDAMIDRKKDLADRIIGSGENWISELGDSDLRELFSLTPGAVVEDAAKPSAKPSAKRGSGA
jgi:superfamily II DNA or RNA helicase